MIEGIPAIILFVVLLVFVFALFGTMISLALALIGINVHPVLIVLVGFVFACAGV